MTYLHFLYVAIFRMVIRLSHRSRKKYCSLQNWTIPDATWKSKNVKNHVWAKVHHFNEWKHAQSFAFPRDPQTPFLMSHLVWNVGPHHRLWCIEWSNQSLSLEGKGLMADNALHFKQSDASHLSQTGQFFLFLFVLIIYIVTELTL